MLNRHANPRKKWDQLKTVLVFALWGSPIGALPIILLFALTGAMHDNVVQNILGALLIMVFSYFFGIIPAVVTGVIYDSWLYRSLAGGLPNHQTLAGFTIGYCTTATLLFFLSYIFDANPNIQTPAWTGLAGGFSGAACAFLDKRRRHKLQMPPVAKTAETRVPLFPK